MVDLSGTNVWESMIEKLTDAQNSDGKKVVSDVDAVRILLFPLYFDEDKRKHDSEESDDISQIEQKSEVQTKTDETVALKELSSYVNNKNQLKKVLSYNAAKALACGKSRLSDKNRKKFEELEVEENREIYWSLSENLEKLGVKKASIKDIKEKLKDLYKNARGVSKKCDDVMMQYLVLYSFDVRCPEPSIRRLVKNYIRRNAQFEKLNEAINAGGIILLTGDRGIGRRQLLIDVCKDMKKKAHWVDDEDELSIQNKVGRYLRVRFDDKTYPFDIDDMDSEDGLMFVIYQPRITKDDVDYLMKYRNIGKNVFIIICEESFDNMAVSTIRISPLSEANLSELFAKQFPNCREYISEDRLSDLFRYMRYNTYLISLLGQALNQSYIDGNETVDVSNLLDDFNELWRQSFSPISVRTIDGKADGRTLQFYIMKILKIHEISSLSEQYQLLVLFGRGKIWKNLLLRWCDEKNVREAIADGKKRGLIPLEDNDDEVIVIPEIISDAIWEYCYGFKGSFPIKDSVIFESVDRFLSDLQMGNGFKLPSTNLCDIGVTIIRRLRFNMYNKKDVDHNTWDNMFAITMCVLNFCVEQGDHIRAEMLLDYLYSYGKYRNTLALDQKYNDRSFQICLLKAKIIYLKTDDIRKVNDYLNQIITDGITENQCGSHGPWMELIQWVIDDKVKRIENTTLMPMYVDQSIEEIKKLVDMFDIYGFRTNAKEKMNTNEDVELNVSNYYLGTCHFLSIIYGTCKDGVGYSLCEAIKYYKRAENNSNDEHNLSIDCGKGIIPLYVYCSTIHFIYLVLKKHSYAINTNTNHDIFDLLLNCIHAARENLQYFRIGVIPSIVFVK